MWEMIKEQCNHSPRKIAIALFQTVFISLIGATWFYIIALAVTLIGG